MIAFLEGTLTRALPTLVEINVHGVGYEAAIPLSTFDRLPAPPAPVKLLTHLVVREDAHLLFGFATEDERALFRMLIQNVSGVGPKVALNVLAGISVVQFRAAIVNNDLQTLSRIKGLGKKTAEKIIVELRDKVGVSAAWEASSARHAMSPADQHANDALLALLALGYKQADAHKAVRAVQQRLPDAAVEDLVRESLKSL